MLWFKLIQPNLDPKAIPDIKRRNAPKIKIPEKLIRFSLYFETFKGNVNVLVGWTWGWLGWPDTISWKNSSIFILPVDSKSFILGGPWIEFISMACSEVFLFGAGVILDLGILPMMLVLMYFFTKTIGTLIDIIHRQMIKAIPSFLEFF